MKHGPDRLNRTLLTLLGLLLVAAGAYGVARGYGAFGDTRATEPVLTKRIGDWDVRLAARQTALQTQYSALEVALSKLKSQSTWLAGQLSTLSTGSDS